MPSDDKNRFGRSFGEGYSYVALGFGFAFAILAFGALGWLLDGWLGTRPLFALVGAGLGGFGGFMSIYYRVKKDTERRGGWGRTSSYWGWGRCWWGGGRGAGGGARRGVGS